MFEILISAPLLSSVSIGFHTVLPLPGHAEDEDLSQQYVSKVPCMLGISKWLQHLLTNKTQCYFKTVLANKMKCIAVLADQIAVLNLDNN